ncbi:MAG: ABC transporter ATP-binding protein [Lachnospiraceae bacterium]|nr:ABC transporter ATP-binding protein [Lachnospiraceae bacterium]
MLLEFEHVTGISKRFALQDITFSLEAGYIMGLAGKNGAGKSTLLDYIMNPKQLYTGQIRLNGVNIREDHVYTRNKLGFVSDENQFFKERTAMQNVELLSAFYEDWDMDIFKDAMKKMELPTSKKVGKMSRGEYFKFQTAFAMAHKSELYLLDEVTAGMDPVFRIDYFKMLQQMIQEEKASILMTSHIQDEISRRMDYVGILENGRLIQFDEGMMLSSHMT